MIDLAYGFMGQVDAPVVHTSADHIIQASEYNTQTKTPAPTERLMADDESESIGGGISFSIVGGVVLTVSVVISVTLLTSVLVAVAISKRRSSKTPIITQTSLQMGMLYGT